MLAIYEHINMGCELPVVYNGLRCTCTAMATCDGCLEYAKEKQHHTTPPSGNGGTKRRHHPKQDILSATCGICQATITNLSRQRKAALRRGCQVYCSDACQDRSRKRREQAKKTASKRAALLDWFKDQGITEIACGFCGRSYPLAMLSTSRLGKYYQHGRLYCVEDRNRCYRHAKHRRYNRPGLLMQTPQDTLELLVSCEKYLEHIPYQQPTTDQPLRHAYAMIANIAHQLRMARRSVNLRE